jgi:hypothetical protein
MKRLALAVSLALVFVAACDDDGDGGGRPDASDAGGDSRPLDATGATCVGTFTGLTRSQLGAATSASGMCRMASDLDYICVADIARMASGCGSTCLMLHPATNQSALLQCVDQCLQSSKMLSVGCANCYRDLLACTLAMCPSECTSDPASAACQTCRTNRGCMGAFFTCSGLPGGTGTDAGGDGRTDATGDGRVDAVMDAGSDMRDAPIETGGDAGDARLDGGADGGADAADAADATAG